MRLPHAFYQVLLRSVVLLPMGCGLGHAGEVIGLKDRTEVQGKLGLTTMAIQVEGGIAVPLADVLEADFETPVFQADYFSSVEGRKELPTDWVGQNIGTSTVPGTHSYADGTLTLTSAGGDVFGSSDSCYFQARPWSMPEGQWTMRVKERSEVPSTVGFMLRTSMAPGGTMFAYGFLPDNGFFSSRFAPDIVPSRDTRFFAPAVPGWIRLSRYANFLMTLETSVEGTTWETSAQNGDMRRPDGTDVFSNTLAGIFATGGSAAAPAKVVLDQITFTPSPALPETLRPGVLLRSGSFLAGGFGGLDTKGGTFSRSGRNVEVKTDQVSAVIYQPATLKQIAEVGEQTGIIVKNGDFMESELQNLSSAGVQMSSVILGPMDYIYTNFVRACVLHPVRPQRSDYEIRLKDGSIIKTQSVTIAAGQITLNEVSGIAIPIDVAEMAQFRAGSAHVQNLIDVTWKAGEPKGVAPVKPVEKKPPFGAANPEEPARPQASDAARPLSPPPPLPVVETWEGVNQEQMLAIMPGSRVEFPLADKFDALSMRIALSSNAPVNAEARVRILEDGRPVELIPPVKSGEIPHQVNVKLQNPKSLTIEVESSVQGVRILLVDPVLIRAGTTP